jgi:hypothetical protein
MQRYGQKQTVMADAVKVKSMRRTTNKKTHFWLIFVISIAGCQNPMIDAMRWSAQGQGSIDRQKARAVAFDPFPLNDLGPEVVGGRPREFANPLPEPNRNELTARPPFANSYPSGR